MQERTDVRTLEMIKQLLSRGRISTTKWAKEPGRVLVIADKKSLETANGQFALCMAVNALSRLYPVLTFIGLSIPDSIVLSADVPLFSKDKIRDSLVDFVSRLHLDCKVTCVDPKTDDWDAILSIGPSKIDWKNKTSIASDGWITYVSQDKLSMGFTEKTNPIGAYVAACIGGMEVFKRVFLKKANLLLAEKAQSDVRWRLKFIKGEISFSAYDYKINEDRTKNPPIPLKVDLGDLYIAGVGAGGGAMAYALASLHDFRGRLTLIDPDEVKPSNMNRYIYALQADFAGNWSKVEVVRELFKRFDELCVQSYPYSYQKLKESQKIGDMDVLVSTVDTKKTRCDMQWDMPRVILDAAVLWTEFYVRRIDLGQSPCLICTHKAKEVKRSLEEIVSAVTGLPKREIARLRSTNSKLTQDHINRMKKFSEKYEFTLPSVGERFSDWLAMHCGELILPETQERFPLPFATILPGFLLAGEMMKERCFHEDILNNYYSYDMINLPVNGVRTLSPFSDCIFCSLPATGDIHTKKYGKKTSQHMRAFSKPAY